LPPSIGERFAEMRGYLLESEQFNAYVQQVTDCVSQTSSNLKDYAQQAVSKVKDTGSSLGELGPPDYKLDRKALQVYSHLIGMSITLCLFLLIVQVYLHPVPPGSLMANARTAKEKYIDVTFLFLRT